MPDKETLYARWLNGEISQEELEALQQEGALEELEAIAKATENLTLPKYDATSAYQKFKSNRPQKEAKIRRLSLRWVTGIAASLLLIVAAIFLFGNSEKTVFASNGANQSFEFEDGSSVLLNDGSSVTFFENNWTENRIVKLEGEAFFEVEKGNSFLVETKNGKVEVLGTSFNVRAWGNDLLVDCFTGKVQVSNESDKAIIEKNESVKIENGKLLEITNFQHNQPFWQAGLSNFSDEDLNIVFEELGRQFGYQVNFEKTKRKFDGAFQHQNLEAALREICVPMGLDFEIDVENKIVKIQEK